MKEKVISEVYDKICKGFNVQFLHSKDFEREFKVLSTEVTAKINKEREGNRTFRDSRRY